jgi:outer membrane lipoprotein SlyB
MNKPLLLLTVITAVAFTSCKNYSPVSGNSYYIDNEAGDDKNPGTTNAFRINPQASFLSEVRPLKGL